MAVCEGPPANELERDDIARAVLADFRERERPGPGGMGLPAPGSLLPHARFAQCVDHTLLRTDATKAEIERLCDQALEWDFAAVCVNGSWVSLCADRLSDSHVRVASVVGFPLGAMTSLEQTNIRSSTGQIPDQELGLFENPTAEMILNKRWDVVEQRVDQMTRLPTEIWLFDKLGRSALSNPDIGKWIANRSEEIQHEKRLEVERRKPKIELPWEPPNRARPTRGVSASSRTSCSMISMRSSPG